MIDARLGRTFYLFAESGGQYWQLAKKGEGAVDGGGGLGERQTQKNPKTTRIHKINETCTPTVLYCRTIARYNETLPLVAENRKRRRRERIRVFYLPGKTNFPISGTGNPVKDLL